MKLSTLVCLLFVACLSGSAFAKNIKEMPPIAHLQLDKHNCQLPCTVNLDATKSKSFSRESISKYIFDFGDGETTESNIGSVTHLYRNKEERFTDRFMKFIRTFFGLKPKIDKFTPKVTVVDSKGKKSFPAYSLLIGKRSAESQNALPVAEIQINTQDNIAPATIKFDASSSKDPDGNIESYLIDFGDGSTSDLQATEHVYQVAGVYNVKLTVVDDKGGQNSAVKSIEIKENTAPVSIINLSADTGKAPLQLQFNGSSSNDVDGTIESYEWIVSDGTQFYGALFEHTFITEGQYTISLNVTDNKGAVNTSQKVVNILPPNKLPNAVINVSQMSGQIPFEVTFDSTLSQDSDGSIIGYAWDFGDGETLFTVVPTTTHIYQAAGDFKCVVTVTDNEGGSASANIAIFAKDGPILPPDPKEVAPEISKVEKTDFADATRFIYTGANPIQYDADPDRINEKTVVIVDGIVTDRDGQPMSGVRVNVKDHPEYGYTLSREDGHYTIALNGGGINVFEYSKDGHLSVQNKEDLPWREQYSASPVIMTTLDPVVSTVNLETQTEMSLISASTVQDNDGVRTASLIIPPATTATAIMPNGELINLPKISVRMTEFTVGDNGVRAMPGQLPPSSAYTYAAEFSVDEAIGATSVEFSKPLYSYLDNFLDMPVGKVVPSGYYDRNDAVWKASDDGIVLGVLSVDADGIAAIDFGDGTPASEETLALINLSLEERKLIAKKFAVGQSFWRVPIKHFTPYDFNYMIWVQEYITKNILAEVFQIKQLVAEPKLRCGSIIDVDNGCLGETAPIPGTDLKLYYTSKYQRKAIKNRTIEIPVVGDYLNPDVVAVKAELTIAGQNHVYELPAQTNQTIKFTWDGKDAYGRDVVGEAPLRVKLYTGKRINLCGQNYLDRNNSSVEIEYTFGYWIPASQLIGKAVASEPSLMADPEKFRSKYCQEQSRNAPSFFIEKDYTLNIGTIDASVFKNGNWTLSDQHFYSRTDNSISRGDGIIEKMNGKNDYVTKEVYHPSFFQRVNPLATSVEDVPYGERFVFDSEGNLYGETSCGILKISKEGILTKLVNTSNICSNYTTYGWEHSIYDFSYEIDPFYDFAVDLQGNVYISYPSGKIYKLSNLGQWSLFAPGYSDYWNTFPDGIQTITNLRNTAAKALRANPDGSLLYVAMSAIYQIHPHGGVDIKISGKGNSYICNSTDSYQLNNADYIGEIMDAQMDESGNIFFATPYNIGKISSDGKTQFLAGSATCEYGVSDFSIPVRAKDSRFSRIRRIELDKKNGIYIHQGEILYLDFATQTVSLVASAASAPSANLNSYLDNTPSIDVQSTSHPLAIGGDGDLYFLCARSVCKINRSSYMGQNLQHIVPSGDEVYIFSPGGLHLETRDRITNQLIRKFEYEDSLLKRIVDRFGNVTQIERDFDGNIKSIISPDGIVTDFVLDESKRLKEIILPSSGKYSFDYREDDMLSQFTRPMNNANTFTYDENGYLLRDADPAGGHQDYVKTNETSGYTAKRTTAENEVTTFRSASFDDVLTYTTTNSTGSYVRSRDIEGELKRITTYSGRLTHEQLFRNSNLTAINKEISRDTFTLPSGLEKVISYDLNKVYVSPLDIFSLSTEENRTIQNGKTYLSKYDRASNTLESSTPQQITSKISYDSLGRIALSSTPGIEDVSYSYQDDGKLSGVTQGDRSWSYGYDENGYLSQTTDPSNRTTSYIRNKMGEVTSVIDPNGLETQLRYDLNGNVIGITPPQRPEHLFSYSLADLQQGILAPELNGEVFETSFVYNLDKEISKIIYPDGSEVSYNYLMIDDKKTSLIDNVSTPRGSYHYQYNNLTEQVVVVTSPDGHSLTYEYDGILPLSESSQSVFNSKIEFNYNNDFLVDLLKINGLAITYNYDDDGKIISAGNFVIDRDYQKVGMISGTNLYNISDSYQYNGYGEVAQYAVKASGTTITSFDYERDPVGRITKITDGQGIATEYQYDLSGRVTEVKINGMVTEAFTYNQNGDRINGTYDDQDRLIEDEKYSYEYNLNGATTARVSKDNSEREEYQYDLFGNLLKYQKGDKTVLYIVDAKNRRIGKKLNGNFQYGLVYKDQLNPVAQVDAQGNMLSLFVYATKAHVPDFMEKDGKTYRIITDHLGSVRYVVDVNSNEIAQEMSYNTFGEVLSDTNPGFQPFGFAGGIYDLDTGFVRFGARDYNPSTGRWMSKDPIGFDGGLMNLYSYVGNDPVANIDSSGLLTLNRDDQPPYIPRTSMPTGQTYMSMQCMESCLGGDLVVTGGNEKSGHSPNSEHYKNNACDFAGPDNGNPQTSDPVKTRMCAKNCGFTNGQYETVPNSPSRDHWHLQIVPGNGVRPL